MIRIAVWLFLAASLEAQPTVPWSSYGHDPQHTGLSTIGAQRLQQVKWHTPVDQVLQGTPGTLYIHYGSPLVTAGNTVLVPVRTSASNTYQVEAHSGANGTLLYTLPTDYTPPPHDWIPSYGPTLSLGARVYYPGAGGTVYYRDQPDSASGPSGQIAFYGNALYAANQSAFAGSVVISTPITADAGGNIYFGFDVTGPNPANLTSGLARIGVDGSGSWISASAAAEGDASIVEVAMNCAPALSNDGGTVYFGVSGGPLGNNTFNGGYLVGVNSATLTPVARVRLKDPSTGFDALLLDDSSASPTVGPDGDVYYGVFESSCCINDDRGWLLHFNSTLTQSKPPGAFGWDTTASVVPAGLVPSYLGASPYLLFTKYNNYEARGPGGNGQNKIAVLDPNATETDPITGAMVMQEILTILGPTPAAGGGVREWCINSGAIDPFAAAAIANSEDGVVYQWSFASNSFTQQVTLTSGVGEAYTPTAIGADGTAYAINDGILFAVGQTSNLAIVSAHTGNFTAGQNGAVYTLTVTNTGSAATSGIVTVSDILPATMTATAMAGQGWTCTLPAGPGQPGTCTRSDPMGAGAPYPAITLTVNVGSNTPGAVTNTATVSSDGAVNSVNSTSNDATTVAGVGPASLNIVKLHNGNFSQGQMNATYTVTVSNAAGAGPSSGSVVVTEAVPSGLTLVSMAGGGWACPTLPVCSRSDPLQNGGSYAPIVVTANIANSATSPQNNTVTLALNGSTVDSSTDTAIIAPVLTPVTILTNPTGLQFSADGLAPQTAPLQVGLSLGSHTIAVNTIQAGPPGSGSLYSFTGWSDGGNASHTITVGSTPITLTASFETQYGLTISASPAADGSVSPNGTVFYANGTVVAILATPKSGFLFSSWSGPVADSLAAETTVTMSGPETVTGHFVTTPPIGITNCSAASFALTVTELTTTPASITCSVSDTSTTVGINSLAVSGLPTWLTAALSSTTLAAGGKTTLVLTPTNLAGLTPGTLGPPTITVSGTPALGGSAVSGSLSSITLTVFALIALSQPALTFDVPTMAAAEMQTVGVTDSPVTPLAVTASVSVTTPAGGAWLTATSGTTPFTSTVTVASGALPSGQYSGSVAYGSGNAPGEPSLPVVLNVGQLAVTGGPINFTHVLGLTSPGTAPLNVSAGPAAINWVSSASGDCAWLTDSSTSGTTPRGGSSPVSVGYTAAGPLTAGVGSHVCTLSYSPAASYGAPAADTVNTTVTLTVVSAPVFTVTPNSIQPVNALVGATTPVPFPVFSITTVEPLSSPPNTIGVTVIPSAQNQSGVFTMVLSSATTPATLTLTANPTGLGIGTYMGSFSIESPNSTQTPIVTVTATLVVNPVPTLQFVPATASASFTAGQAAPLPASFSTSLQQTGPILDTLTLTSNVPWLIPSPSTTSAAATAVTVNFGALPAAPATGVITARGTAGEIPVTFTVALTVNPPPTLTLTSIPSQTIAAGAQAATFTTNASLSSAPVNPATLPVAVSAAPSAGCVVIPSAANPTSLSVAPAAFSFTLGPGSGTFSGTCTANLVFSAGGTAATILPAIVNSTAASLVVNGSLTTATPGGTSFGTYTIGSAVPPALPINTTSNPTSAGIGLSSSATWLAVNVGNTTTPANAMVSIVTADPAITGAANGATLSATITVVSPQSVLNCPTAQVVGTNCVTTTAFSLTILKGGLAVSPGSLTFNLPASAAPAAGTETVTASSGAVVIAVPFTATPSVALPAGGAWLGATGGTTTSSGPAATSTVTVTSSGLGQGQYTGSVAYGSSEVNNTSSVQVLLNVGALAISGGPVSFTHVLGLTTPSTAMLAVTAGPAAINWVSSASGDCAWLTDSLSSGATPGAGGSNSVILGYTAAGAASAGAGNHVCTLGYSAAAAYGSAAPPVNTTVTLNVVNSPVFVVAPSGTQTVTVLAGATSAPPVRFQITDASPGSNLTPVIGVMVTQSSQNLGYFNILNDATTPATLTILPNPAGLPAGTYTGNFTISSPNSAGTVPVTVTVSLVVSALPPPPCLFTLTPSSFALTNAVPSDGSTPVTAPGSFIVTPSASCTAAVAWTASSSANWLMVTSGGNGDGTGPVSTAFKALSNPTSSARTGTISISPPSGPPYLVYVTQPGSTAALQYRQVAALYQSILGRDPDSGGYAFWTGPGAPAGVAALSQMADDFLTGPEAFNGDFAVIATYQSAFGAPPTYAEFTSAVSAIRQGTQTIGGLFNFLNAGNGSFTAATLYQNLLNRSTTAADGACIGSGPVACLQTIIGYPATTAPAAAVNNEFQSTGTFANLTSAAGDHTNNLYIQMLYFVILDRDPDAGGLGYWLSVANSGGAGLLFQGPTGYPVRLQILGPGTPPQGFIGSSEFQSLFQ